MSGSKKYPYPIIDIEPLLNPSNTSSEQQFLGYHGTSSSNANSIKEEGFTKQAFARQGMNGLRPHERGLYTSPDWEVSEGYACNDDGRHGEILGVFVRGGTPHVVTSTYMDQRGVIKGEMDKANEEFGRGNYSFTGPQDPRNKEPETITQFLPPEKQKHSHCQRTTTSKRNSLTK